MSHNYEAVHIAQSSTKVTATATDKPAISLPMIPLVINIGLAFGPWAGGHAISSGFGLSDPLFVGFGMALVGLLTVLPRSLRNM